MTGQIQANALLWPGFFYDRDGPVMLNFRLGLSGAQRMRLDVELVKAKQAGDLPRVNRVLSILALADGMAVSAIAHVLRVSREAVRGWVNRYLLRGVRGLRAKKSPGRRPKLTKSQRRKLCRLLDEGPAKAGLPGNCWRSPMIQVPDSGALWCLLQRSLH
jgi:hypothetical protein